MGDSNIHISSDTSGYMNIQADMGINTNIFDIKSVTSSGIDIISHDGLGNGLKLNSTLVTSSASELNLLDGATSGSIVGSKAVIYNSSGEIEANKFNNLYIKSNETDFTNSCLIRTDSLTTGTLNTNIENFGFGYLVLIHFG